MLTLIVEDPDQPAARRVPELRSRMNVRGEHQMPPPGERGIGGMPWAGGKRLDDGLGGGIDQPRLAVIASGEDRLAVGAELDTGQGSLRDGNHRPKVVARERFTQRGFSFGDGSPANRL